MTEVDVVISVGPYELAFTQRPDGRSIIEVHRIDTVDEHDHPHGPSKTIDLDALFADEKIWGAAE